MARNSGRLGVGGVWSRIRIFQENRKPSQQNVLGRIVLQSEHEADSPEEAPTPIRHIFPSITNTILFSSKRRTINKTDVLLVVSLSVSLFFNYTLVLTNWYEEQVLKELILENNSIMFDYWKEPPIKPLISIYVFNYTNPEEALSGKERPNVEQVGPYTFRETMERVNVKFYMNGTVSYQEKRSHQFVEEISTSLQDTIITPNLPLITAVAFSKKSYLLSRIALSIVFKSFDMKPFHKVTAHEFIWGSDDGFTNVASKVARLLNKKVPSSFGVLSSRIGVSPDVVTIFSGATGFDKFGVIDKFNGESTMNAWPSECDRLDGGDGTLYPPGALTSYKPLYVYAKEFCRKMPLHFEKHVQTQDGLPALRYKNPENIFSSPQENPINSCFCLDHECSPDGLQNVRPCSFGAPFYISLPHFLRADDKLRQSVSGLAPNAKYHTSYIDIHKKLGIPIAGVSRLQMNIKVIKSSQFSPLDELKDGIFLPIAWMQCEIGKLPDNLKSIVYHVTFSVTFLEYFLIMVSIFSTIFFFSCIVAKLRKPDKTSDWILN